MSDTDMKAALNEADIKVLRRQVADMRRSMVAAKVLAERIVDRCADGDELVHAEVEEHALVIARLLS